MGFFGGFSLAFRFLSCPKVGLVSTAVFSSSYSNITGFTICRETLVC